MDKLQIHVFLKTGNFSADAIQTEHALNVLRPPTATPTTIRVVCTNTLAIALDGTSRALKVPHNTRFDSKVVKQQLGISVSQWDEFRYRMRHLPAKGRHTRSADFTR